MSDGQVPITVRNPRTEEAHLGHSGPAKMRADSGMVVVYDLPPGEAFKLDPEKDINEFQLALDAVIAVALKQREQQPPRQSGRST